MVGQAEFTFFFFNIYLFIYLFLLFMAVLGLRFCARAFSVVASRGHSSSRCAGLSLSQPLPLQSTGSRRAGSVVVAHGTSRSAACGIFPNRGSNPCPLHWQADSQPLRHQGSPEFTFNEEWYLVEIDFFTRIGRFEGILSQEEGTTMIQIPLKPKCCVLPYNTF